MLLNRLRIPLVIISALLPIALLGCQTNSLNHSAQTSTVIDDKNWSATTLKPRLFQTITKYEWQLTHVSDDEGKINPFNQNLPLTMDVHPDFLTFTEGCQRYRVFFDMWLPLPYPYAQTNIRGLSTDCIATNSANIKTLSNKTTIKGDIENVLNSAFIPYSDKAFRFDPLLPKSVQLSDKTSKQLALKINKGKTLIFSGTPKPKHPVTGIPLTNELLERYQWHLIRATDKTGKDINELTQADTPITATYQLDIYNQSDDEREQGYQQGAYGQSMGVWGSFGCNGISGSYALSTSQTLLTGSFPSTMMSCGEAKDDMELRVRRMMLYTTSKLTLTHPDNNPIANSVAELEPNYLLTQTLDSGETLIWKNEAKKTS